MAESTSKSNMKQQAFQKAHDYELQYHGCSQAILLTFQELLGLKDELATKAATPLVGGLGMGKTCGALTGAVLVLGMKYGRTRMEDGIAGLLPSMLPTQKLVRMFEEEFGSTDCSDIAEVDWTNYDDALQALTDACFLEKCAQLVGRTAEMLTEIIEEQG